MTPQAKDTLRAPRIRQRVLVARDHPDPERVRRQMHDALATHLGDALGAAFERTVAHDDAVWRIRHLTLDVSVNACWDAPSLARAWAAKLAQAVHRAIETGGDGVTVVRFDSDASYLASFLIEVANGTAWSRWWFDGFDGLHLLSRSATVRTALVREPALGLAALHTMSTAGVELVIQQLSVVDARVVLDALMSPLDAGDAVGATQLLLSAHRALDAPMPRADGERWCVRLVVEASRESPSHASGSLAALARAMARLIRLAEGGASRTAIVSRLLAEGNVNGLRLVLAGDDAECIAPLAQVGAPSVAAVIGQLIDASRPTRANPTDTATTAYMPVAAALLLAPLAAAMPFEEVARAWPPIGRDGDPPARCATSAALLRLLAIATACGGERASRVLDDDTARLLAGVGSGVSRAQLREWLAERTAADAVRLEDAVGVWRVENGSSACNLWMLADVDSDTRECVVAINCARGCWFVVRENAADDEEMHERVRRIAGADSRVIASAEVPAEYQSDDAVMATFARRDRVSDELRWLALPGSIGAPRACELALATVAQGMLRDLAWRLPGFARASVPHLWTNFLAVDAQLEHTPTQVIACLSRPPLAMIASMAGLMRARYRLPWLGDRTVALYPAELT